MGNILNKGWDTLVNELNSEKVHGGFTLKDFYRVARDFAKSIDSKGDATVKAVFMKCSTTALLSTLKCSCTKKPFLDFCHKVAFTVIEYGKHLGANQRQALQLIVEKTLRRLAKYAVNPPVKHFFKKVAKNAAPAEASKEAMNLAKGAAGALAEEAAENISRLRQAASSAKSALIWGAAIEGVCWGYSCYTSYRKLQEKTITPEQHRRTVIKRTGGAAGSLGGGTLGSFVGTLVFPGVGTFVGGFVGGVAGDYFGKTLGEKVDDYVQ